MKKRTKIFLVAGARPNFMKIAPVIRQFEQHKDFFKTKIIHTGQHYDYEMNEAFFHDLEIPAPDYFLNARSGTHARQTAKIMTRFEDVCIKEEPDLVVVVGDVNSTLACSTVAKKLGIEVAHIEAGMRSFDMSMPEEINRILTDSITDYFFITEASGYKNLIREGKDKEKLFFVGNVMIDNLFYGLKKLKRCSSSFFKTTKLKNRLKKYACLTLHRPSNVDNKTSFFELMHCLEKISEKIPIIFSVHPRTKKKLKGFGINVPRNIITVPSLSYLEFLNLLKDSTLVLTDSGGLQEETTVLGIPCLTLRENTERPVTIKKGTNVLIGRDYKKLLKEVDKILSEKGKKGKRPRFWDGKASKRIVKILTNIY